MNLAMAYEDAGSVTPRWLLRVGWGRLILLVTLTTLFFGLVGYSIFSPSDPHERYLAATSAESPDLPSMPAVPQVGAGFDTYASVSLQHPLGTDQRGRAIVNVSVAVGRIGAGDVEGETRNEIGVSHVPLTS